MPQRTSHLSRPARISHLLRPSVRKDYVLVGYEAADIPALTQAPPHCPERRHAHAYMNAVMPISWGLHFWGGPKQYFWANQCWNVFICRRKELILSKIFKKQGLLICKLGAGLRHLSEEPCCNNPQPLYKQQFVYSYTDWEVRQLWITSVHEVSWSVRKCKQ